LLAEKRVLTSQDHVISDDVSPVRIVNAPTVVTSVATEATKFVSKEQPQQQLSEIQKNQSVTVSSHPNQQRTHKTLTVAKQPPTKPLPLLGMERRAHMMAERRQARKERQKQREEELLVSHYWYILIYKLQLFVCL